MDTSDLPFAKGRPASLLREDRRKARVSKDEQESATVRERSKGQCEVWVSRPGRSFAGAFVSRCLRRAVHVHHLMGGNGVRGRGKSALAKNKLHLCAKCHADIHAHVLVPDGTTWRRIT